MTDELAARLYGVFERPIDGVSTGLLVGIGGALVTTGVLVAFIPRERVGAEMLSELRQRWAVWVVIALVACSAIVGGAISTAVLVGVISLLGIREFGRGTGLFRDHAVVGVLVVAIVAAAFGAIDNRFAQFTAVAPLAAVLIAIVRLLHPSPAGYLQSVALGVVALLLLVVGPSYLTMLTIDDRSTPLLLMLLAAVALGDVSAFVFGKALRGPKLAPLISPGKTISGSVGSLVVTTGFVAALSSAIYADAAEWHVGHAIGLGVVIAACGQLGDLVLSAIKRDLGIKDFGSALPGHGGLLDRIDSLLLSTPASFYYLAQVVGIGTGSETQVITG